MAIIRIGLMLPAAFVFITITAYIWTPQYEGAPDAGYPVTVRMWLDDGFIGGAYPPAFGPDPATALLAGGNDLILVSDADPRCPEWSTAWVVPYDTNHTSGVYNATIRCLDGNHTPEPKVPQMSP